MPVDQPPFYIQPVTDPAVSSAIASLQSAQGSYVGNGAVMTLATLLATYPANSGTAGKYAHVSDLYGSVDEILRCRFDGTNYNWVPQRESYSGTTASSAGVVQFVPLVTPSTLIFSATTLAGNMTISPQTTNAYIGQPAEFVTQSTLGLGAFTMTITGLVGSNVSLLAGQTRRLRYSPNGWVLLP